MKFKDFMSAVGYLPATALGGMFNLVLGSTKRDANGNVVMEPTGKTDPKTKAAIEAPAVNRGALGWVLYGIQAAARAASDFIYAHRKAIAVAAWLSLAVAGGVALTLFLWPAALAAVATFSVAGFSIASVFGANALVQIAVAAGLAAAAASVATYTVAAVANTINWIRSCFPAKGKQPTPESSHEENASNDDDVEHGTSHYEMSSLMRKPTTQPSSTLDGSAPFHGNSPLDSKKKATAVNEENSAELENSKEATFS